MNEPDRDICDGSDSDESSSLPVIQPYTPRRLIGEGDSVPDEDRSDQGRPSDSESETSLDSTDSGPFESPVAVPRFIRHRMFRPARRRRVDSQRRGNISTGQNEEYYRAQLPLDSDQIGNTQDMNLDEDDGSDTEMPVPLGVLGGGDARMPGQSNIGTATHESRQNGDHVIVAAHVVLASDNSIGEMPHANDVVPVHSQVDVGQQIGDHMPDAEIQPIGVSQVIGIVHDSAVALADGDGMSSVQATVGIVAQGIAVPDPQRVVIDLISNHQNVHAADNPIAVMNYAGNNDELPDDEVQILDAPPQPLARRLGPFDNGLESTWRDHYNNPSSPRLVINQDDDTRCPLCWEDMSGGDSDSPETRPTTFMSNHLCSHRLCISCCLRNVLLSKFPSCWGLAAELHMEKSGSCPVRCHPSQDFTWYNPLYLPLRPPNNQYVYGHIARYSGNTDQGYLDRLNRAETTNERNDLRFREGFAKRSEMAITSKGMWNTYSEIYFESNKPMYSGVQLRLFQGVRYVVDLQVELFSRQRQFDCDTCDCMFDLEYEVLHQNCLEDCQSRHMCMRCACNLDNAGRQVLEGLSIDQRQSGSGHFKMDIEKRVSWRCNTCHKWGIFERLDRMPLNWTGAGRYGIRSFNQLNEQVRRDIGDSHRRRDLPDGSDLSQQELAIQIFDDDDED